MPDAAQIGDWAGLPKSYELGSTEANADGEKAAGTLLRGRYYGPSKTQIKSLSSYTSYTIKVFAGGTLMRDDRKLMIDVAGQFQRLRESREDATKDGFGNYGEFSLAGGQSFYVVMEGMGPGGGIDMAFIFTDRFDFIVEQVQSYDDDKSPDHRAKPPGPTPKTPLPDLFRRVFEAIVKDATPAR